MYTHTSVIRTPKLRALRSTGHPLGEFQWTYYYSFVEILLLFCHFLRKYGQCHHVPVGISKAFPHQNVCVLELRTFQSHEQCPVPDKRGMRVVVTLFIAPCRAVETPYLRFFLFLLCVFNGFLFIFFLLPFILFLQTLFLFLVLLFLFRPGCVEQIQCTRNEEKGIMNTVNIQNLGAAKFRHFTIFDISAAIYFRRGVEGMV